MVAIQAVVELFGIVPAFVWIGLILVIVLLTGLTVMKSKRRSREVAELNKIFADTDDKSFDQPLALKRRPRRKSEAGEVQEVKEGKRETEENRLSEGKVKAKVEKDQAEQNETGEEKGANR